MRDLRPKGGWRCERAQHVIDSLETISLRTRPGVCRENAVFRILLVIFTTSHPFDATGGKRVGPNLVRLRFPPDSLQKVSLIFFYYQCSKPKIPVIIK